MAKEIKCGACGKAGPTEYAVLHVPACKECVTAFRRGKQFAEALKLVREAQESRDKAFSECDHSWGYFGHDQEEALDHSYLALGQVLQHIHPN